MEIRDKEKIREAVRESYGKVAKTNGISIGTSPAASCFGGVVVSVRMKL